MAAVLSFLERSDWQHSPTASGEDVSGRDVPGNSLPELPQIHPSESAARDELRLRLLEMIRRNEALRNPAAR